MDVPPKGGGEGVGDWQEDRELRRDDLEKSSGDRSSACGGRRKGRLTARASVVQIGRPAYWPPSFHDVGRPQRHEQAIQQLRELDLLVYPAPNRRLYRVAKRPDGWPVLDVHRFLRGPALHVTWLMALPTRCGSAAGTPQLDVAVSLEFPGPRKLQNLFEIPSYNLILFKTSEGSHSASKDCHMPLGRFFTFLCVTTFLFGCQAGNTTAPDHLIGTWKTSAPGYADELMTFTKETLVFGNENGESRGYSIRQSVEQQETSQLLYIFTYRDAGSTDFRLAFYYKPEGGGTITFKNQQHLTWIRTGASL